MKGKSIMKTLALVIVFSMIFTSVVFATPKFNKIDKKTKDYESALNSLIQKEIVKGYGNDDYGLSGNVKRGDVIIMIIRMLDQYGIIDQDDYTIDKLSNNYLKIFDDVDFKDYFYGYIKIAKELGIAKGDGIYFKPNKPVTIQEVIWLIERTSDLLDIEFDSDKIDELEEIYAGDLKDFAKRRDVFWMLYLILDDLEIDDEIYELEDIKHTMIDNETFEFNDKMFLRVFENDNLDYVKFILPKDGTLYYNYDADSTKNSLVLENKKYYISDDDLDDDELVISNITFKPKADFNGKVTIEYKAYDDDKIYNGLIVINVEKNEDLVDIKYIIKENNDLKIDYRNFDNYIDKLIFTPLDEKIGTLYFDYNRDGKLIDDERILKNEEISRLDLRYIYFVPYQDYKGEVTISYVAYDGNEQFNGKIIVTVQSVQEIPTLSYERKIRDEEVIIDFEDYLYKSIEKEIYDKIDYAEFTLPSKGNLMIKYNGNDYRLVDKDTEYELEDIEAIKYIFDERGTVDINYTIFDEDTSFKDKAYDGLIKIEVIR